MQSNDIGRLNNPANANQVQSQEARKRASNIPRSMIDLTTQILFVLLNIVFVVITVVMSQINPSELNEYTNRWLAYFIQIIGVALGIVGTALHYYVKNFSDLKNFWME